MTHFSSRVELPPPQLAIIICTWNRSDVLSRCLDALEHQSIDPALFEVTVVDNNSTDDTAIVVRNVIARNQIRVRYLFETQQGLSTARNRGMAESTSEFIGFLDDDSVAHPDYAENLLKAFTETDADMIAGKIVTIVPDNTETDIPLALLARLSFSGLDLDVARRPIRDGEFAIGANMSARRSLVDRIGGFSRDLGYVGPSKIVGEDTDFCERAVSSGAVVIWDPSVVVDHAVSPARLTIAHLRSAAFDYGVGKFRQRYGDRPRAAIKLAVTAKCAAEIAFAALVYVIICWSAAGRLRSELKMRRCMGKLSAAFACEAMESGEDSEIKPHRDNTTI